MNKKPLFGLDEILSILPHRPPFLFVDEVIRFKANQMIIAQRTIRSDEPWFEGHFPQKAIMPGALVLDALAQTSGLLLGFSQKTEPRGKKEPPALFFLASSQIKFISTALPGETLNLISESREKFEKLYSYDVEATVGRKTVAKGILTLAAIEGNL